MTELTLTKTRLRAGTWEGVVTGEPPAQGVEVTHLGTPLAGVTLTALPDQPGAQALRVPIPAETLSDGVQTFLVRDPASGATLGQFTVIAGSPLDEDLRAEIALLRAELDMLKRAFRRHCLETMG
jgi:hypothetical protein